MNSLPDGSIATLRSASCVSAFLYLMVFLQVGHATGDESQSLATGQTSQIARAKLEAVIAEVRRNEELFQKLDVIVRKSIKINPEPSEPDELINEKLREDVVTQVTETQKYISLGSKFKYSSSRTFTRTTTEKQLGETRIVSNGIESLAIEEGNSATRFRKRHEPAAMIPPHCWCLFTGDVNYPLSTCLMGIEAIKLHPKVRMVDAKTLGYPTTEKVPYDFKNIEAQWLGEESIEGLACHKILIRRWRHFAKDPDGCYLWLAKERNLHIARSKAVQIEDGKEIDGDTSSVTRWREVKPGIWLPSQVDSDHVKPNPEKDLPPIVERSHRLTLFRAVIDPVVDQNEFDLPAAPDSIPQFVVGPDGHLTEAPFLPRPTTAVPETSLESILNRVGIEEAKYDQIDVETNERYVLKDYSAMMQGNLVLSLESNARSIVAGSKAAFYADTRQESADGTVAPFTCHAVFDGRWFRQLDQSISFGDKPAEQSRAAVMLTFSEDCKFVRAHTILVRNVRRSRSLAEYFSRLGKPRSNNQARIQTPTGLKYVGDETVGQLHCHKLTFASDNNTESYSIWLARDRNLIPVRLERWVPFWSTDLPVDFSFVSSLREIRPGIWFPESATMLVFNVSEQEGLKTGWPVLSVRKDIGVKTLTVDPNVDDIDFSSIEAPKGTQLSVFDENNVQIGQFPMADTGNIGVSTSMLTEFRMKRQITQGEAEQRKALLDALIDQPAPELSSDGWIDQPVPNWKRLEGKMVIIYFWATWAPFSTDFAKLKQAEKELNERKTGECVVLSVHLPGADREQIQEILRENKFTSPTIIDVIPETNPKLWGTMLDRFAVKQIPLIFVIDDKRKVIGYGTLDDVLEKARKR